VDEPIHGCIEGNKKGILFAIMTTQPVNLTFRQEPSPGTLPVRWSSRMWENLNLSSSGHDYTLLKIVGIAVVLGILGLVYYKARTSSSSVFKKLINQIAT
jgi:hypothetical protein